MNEFNPLDFADSFARTVNSGQLDDDKIKSLGRAIEKQSENLLNAYLSYGITVEDLVSNPTYRTLRESGAVLESQNKARLSESFRKILDSIAKKSYRQHIMPDIEEYKRELKKLTGLININEQAGVYAEAHHYMEQVLQTASDLAEALQREMTNIEYTIYAELNNTYDLNSKRLILKSLMEKIEAQIQKISSLSRDELLDCCQDNHKVYRLLKITLFEVIDQVLEAFDGYLAKTATMLDSMNRQLNANKTQVWRLYTALKQGQFDPSQVQLSYEDLMAHQLAYGGLEFERNTRVDISDSPRDINLLHEIIYKLPKEKPKQAVTPSVEQQLITKTDVITQRQISEFQQIAFDYAKYNNHKPLKENVSVKDYWQLRELQARIDFKPFLALILHTCRSDFANSHILEQKDNTIWQLFLKVGPSDIRTNTKRIIDARIIRYQQDNAEIQDFVQEW